MAQRALICASSTSTTDYVREMYVGVLKRLVDIRIRQAHEASGGSGDNVLLEYLGHPEYVDALQVLFNACWCLLARWIWAEGEERMDLDLLIPSFGYGPEKSHDENEILNFKVYLRGIFLESGLFESDFIE